MELRKMAMCRECLTMLRAPTRAGAARIAAPATQQWRSRSFASTSPSSTPRGRYENPHNPRSHQQRTQHLPHVVPCRHKSGTDNTLAQTHARIFELTSTAIQPEDNKLPSEQRILYVLEQLEAISTNLIDAKSVAGAKAARDGKDSGGTTATSALLGSVNARQYPAFLSKASLLNLISGKAEEIMRHPSVFITPSILKSYVQLQSQLHQPASFPDIFYLYANKASPKLESGGHISFTPATPNKINAAIDPKAANAALDSAIAAHNLPLCTDIIDTTFASLAFRKSKTLRQALVPFGGVMMAPGAAYALSTAFSSWQNTMDPGMATGIAFAGIMTYITTVAGLGYVVITTANDQMDRVSWARGVPLWERWVREEERAALDKVAGAWGFKDNRWRGMEEGAEWDDLRENIGRRGMALDKTELMEGMQ